MPEKSLPEWERLMEAAARLQRIVPGSVLVGGTAAASHVHHRLSFDADHAVGDLRGRFDEILAQLESVAGWKTARVRRPVLILGSLDGIETGVRQLIRETPLETERISVGNEEVVVPTLPEMLRIKGVLILKRNATRDYLDFAAMARQLGPDGVAAALSSFDSLYPQPIGQSALQQLLVQLANPMPFDLDDTDLSDYKRLVPEWRDWMAVAAACADAASTILATAKRT